MTKKKIKSNEGRLSSNIKRTATTVIITAAVVGSIGITNSVKAQEPEVRITSSDNLNTSRVRITNGDSTDTLNMNNRSTNGGGSSSAGTSPKAETLTSDNDGPVLIKRQNNALVTDRGVSNKEELVNKAKEEIDKLEHLSDEQKKEAKRWFEADGAGEVGNGSKEDLKKNVEALVKKAKEINDKEKKKKESSSFNKEELINKAKEKIDKLEHLLGWERDEAKRLLKESETGEVGNGSKEDTRKNVEDIVNKVEKINDMRKKKNDESTENPKTGPNTDKKESNPKVVVPELKKKPESKRSEENKPKPEEKKNEIPKALSPKDNKDSLKPRIAAPKSDNKEKTENKKPEMKKTNVEEKKNIVPKNDKKDAPKADNEADKGKKITPENKKPEIKKPEIKSPQNKELKKKGDSNKMNESPKKENNKNKMSNKMNEAPKNIKKKLLPQMGVQSSIATSLMGLSGLAGAVLMLFKKNDK
ncbi:hypothetical protein [Peptostreptococcus sp. D1]|uniref:hypothetical protein n=1 Tax=Peptostreptococcus sp. D1 TaxID=72304 RepID=UPI0008EAE654|nr:hypothetical protein [Peptostreptococcus sp. D1]SFE53378.1 hypothetical protein SAMN02910278_01057 [Peptostreptococcus sp. D1]